MSGDGNTSYRLKVEGVEGEDLDFLLFKLRKAVPNARHYLDEFGKDVGNGHDWRDLEEGGEGSMLAFSATVPEMLIQIDEEGTYERDEFEARYYFKGGKHVKIEPEVVTTWPQFDEGMLK